MNQTGELERVSPAEEKFERWRRRIGLVSQDVTVFNDTIRNNLLFIRPDATDAEIDACLETAYLKHVVEALPNGLDTVLGENGIRLSGGERQRLALARALIGKPEILLLDEATSALDAESERLVQNALEQLMKDRTTIIIAHRLATVLKADRIVVMDQGQIVDVGRHHELVERDPLYARLARLQFGVGLQGGKDGQAVGAGELTGELPGVDAEQNLSIQ